MHSFFGDNVKKLRTAKKMSQEQLADIFGITKAGISYWETGRSEPNFATVQKLADFFGVTTSDLLGEADDEIFINAALEYERVTLYSALCCGYGNPHKPASAKYNTEDAGRIVSATSFNTP